MSLPSIYELEHIYWGATSLTGQRAHPTKEGLTAVRDAILDALIAKAREDFPFGDDGGYFGAFVDWLLAMKEPTP